MKKNKIDILTIIEFIVGGFTLELIVLMNYGYIRDIEFKRIFVYITLMMSCILVIISIIGLFLNKNKKYNIIGLIVGIIFVINIVYIILNATSRPLLIINP